MPRYLTSGVHKITGDERLSICAREKLHRPRLAVWVQYYDWDTKSEADGLIQWAKDVGVTDLFLMAVNYDASPKYLYGYAAACSNHITATRFDGAYPFDYMVKNCTPLGINVHAWFCMFYYNWWCNTTTSFLNSPLGSAYQDTTSSGSQMWKMNDATARASVVDALQSFALSNPRVGIHLDYIRADGTSDIHTAQDITNLVSEIRAACPGVELSVCSVTGPFQERSGANMVCQRARDWASSGIVDTVAHMGYTYGFQLRGEQVCQIKAMKGQVNLVGFSAETLRNRTSDVANRIQMYQGMGFRHFALFDYEASRWRSSTWKALAQAINVDNNIASLYPDMGVIRKLTINPNTNVVINVGGTDYTITWAQLGLPTETDPADLKANAESAVGFTLKPFIFQSNLCVAIGDWYST